MRFVRFSCPKFSSWFSIYLKVRVGYVLRVFLDGHMVLIYDVSNDLLRLCVSLVNSIYFVCVCMYVCMRNHQLCKVVLYGCSAEYLQVPLKNEQFSLFLSSCSESYVRSSIPSPPTSLHATRSHRPLSYFIFPWFLCFLCLFFPVIEDIHLILNASPSQ